MSYNKLFFQIAITLIPGIGDITAKKLIAYCGGVEAVFKEKKVHLEKIPGIGAATAKLISAADIFDHAEAELKFIEKNNIRTLFFTEKDYPKRLKNCDDSPVLIYYKGEHDFNKTKFLSVVGTRNITDYGKEVCENIIADFASDDVTIVSGLAYGVDICAHKAALKNNLKTIAVLAHGLDRTYPSLHTETAKEIAEQGALLTDYPSETNPDRQNFPDRNRIIAGLSDAILVIESTTKGGSLITAEYGNAYNRDVFAIPGKIKDKHSEGCNRLISRNKAALVTSAKEIAYNMGWETKTEKKKATQKQLFVELNPEEKLLADILSSKGNTNIDALCIESKLSMSKVAATLLNLEFAGIVSSLPGKIYKLN